MAARFAAVCRLCGEIRLNDDDSDCEDHLKELILNYIGVPIKSDDTLPKSVCVQCRHKIEQFHLYVNQCRNIQIKLEKYVNGDAEEIKLESSDEFKQIKEEDVSYDDEIAIKFESSNEIDDNYDDTISDNDYDCDDSDISVKLKPSKRRKNDSLQSEKSKKKRTQPFLTKYIIFSCYVCEQKYDNWYRLKSHISQTHNQLPKVKCICGCFIKSKSAIYRHVAGHNDPSNFACDQCPRLTKTLDALKTHKMRHVPKTDRVFQCSSCDKTFSSKENLKSHEKVHIPITERSIFPCSICGNKFTTKSAVVGHIRSVHEKIKRFICDICGYACSTRGELVQHRAIHSEEKQFECKICLKRFKTYSNLKAHIDIHPETSYPCTICGKVLNSRRTWRKHFLVHQDLYQHKCPHCNKSFKRRHTLKMHMVTHTGAKPVKCPWCPQRFSYSSSLRTHKQKMHLEQVLAVNGDKEQNIVQPTSENSEHGIEITINPIITIIE